MNRTFPLILIFIVCVVSCFSLVSSAPPFQGYSGETGYNIITPSIETIKQNENYTFNFHVLNSSNGVPIISGVTCYFNLYDIDGTSLYEGEDETPSSNYDYSFFVNENNFSSLGNYPYLIQCNSTTNGGQTSYYFEVTQNGMEKNVWIYFFLGVFFISLFMGYYYLNQRIDYDRWYNKIVQRNSDKNFIKVVYSSVGYNLIKNKLCNYYFLGFPVVILLVDLILTYQVQNLLLVAENILFVYSLGILMVTFSLFGQFQEFITNLIQDTLKTSWGITK